jgi:CheY-like chemotaxis protein
VTADAFAEDRRRGLAAGIYDYHAKPFDREARNRVLEQSLGGRPRAGANPCSLKVFGLSAPHGGRTRALPHMGAQLGGLRSR